MLFLEPDSAKGVTDLSAGVGDAKCDRTGAKTPVEIGEELRAGEIDVRNRAERKHDEPDRFGSALQHLEDALADELDVEVEQRRLAADDEQARLRRGVGMT